MNQTLHIKLSDQAFASLERTAKDTDQPLEGKSRVVVGASGDRARRPAGRPDRLILERGQRLV